jgi:hypothetical protein
VVANNTKTILSSNGGNIEYLDCEKGKSISHLIKKYYSTKTPFFNSKTLSTKSNSKNSGS